MINTIIFDLDGTLLYTLKDLNNALNYAFAKHGFAKVSLDATKKALGFGPIKLISLLTTLEPDNPRFDTIYQDFLGYYGQHNNDETIIYPQITELLTKLKKQNIKLAVLSNKQDVDTQAVIKHYLPNTFDIIMGTSAKVKKKPNIDGLIEIVHSLDTTVANCLYVGDSEVDVLTAANAKMKCIAVTYGYRSKKELITHGATNLIDNPLEILEYLK